MWEPGNPWRTHNVVQVVPVVPVVPVVLPLPLDSPAKRKAEHKLLIKKVEV